MFADYKGSNSKIKPKIFLEWILITRIDDPETKRDGEQDDEKLGANDSSVVGKGDRSKRKPKKTKKLEIFGHVPRKA